MMNSIRRLFTYTMVLAFCGTSGLFGQRMPQDNWHRDAEIIEGFFWSVALGSNGRIYMGRSSGQFEHRVSITCFDATGELITEFAFINDVFEGIATDSESNVYVFYRGSKIIRKFSPDGVALTQWGGTLGSGPGEFDPGFIFFTNLENSLIAIDSADNVYVVDIGNTRIQVFNSQGTFLRDWGNDETQIGNLLDAPTAIAIDNLDKVYVLSRDFQDPSKNRLQVFDTEGNRLDGVTGAETLGVRNDPYLITFAPDQLVVLGGGGQFTFLNQGLNEISFIRPLDFRNVGLLNSSGGGIVIDADGNLIYLDIRNERVVVLERTYRAENQPIPSAMPLPVVVSAEQRPAETLVDIDFQVLDADDATVEVSALAFVGGGNDLSSLLKLNTFVEGTDTNVGSSVATNTVNRLTWNAAADFTGDFAQLQFEILAKDNRNLLGFHFITLPAQGQDPALTLSAHPVDDDELLSLWYWLIATDDQEITLTVGQVFGVGGSFDGLLLADNTVTTSDGRDFLYSRLGVRKPTQGEIDRALSGNFGFESVTLNSVVKVN